MIRSRPFAAALAPLCLGLVLIAASHPDLARMAVGGGHRALSLARLGELALHHLAIAGGGLALIGTVGISLGILATRGFAEGWRGGIDAAAALAQALPPVVVVALALPVLGFGAPPTLLALLAYGIMPILRGTVGAIEGVPREAREAAQAIGMTPAQILAQVELPLAAPGILDALRIALVLSIATAAIGALAGAATLGTPIVAGLQNQNFVAIWQGASATAALAFLGDALMLALAALIRRE